MTTRPGEDYSRVAKRLTRPALIAGVGRGVMLNAAQSLSSTLSMAHRQQQSVGADALLVYPPSWVKHHEQRDSLIVEHHKPINHRTASHPVLPL